MLPAHHRGLFTLALVAGNRQCQVVHKPRRQCATAGCSASQPALHSVQALVLAPVDDLHAKVVLCRRFDPALNRNTAAASAPTRCRFEQRASTARHRDVQAEFVHQFITSHGDRVPEERVLDFDATDVPLHGNQELRFFHGDYDNYCYLPLYVFCREQLLVTYLCARASSTPAKHAGTELA